MSTIPAAFFTLPGPGDTMVQRVQSKVRNLALRHLLTADLSGLSSGITEAVQQVRMALGAAKAPQAALALMRNPDILVPLLVDRAGVGGAPGRALSGALPHLLAAMAHEPALTAAGHTILCPTPLDALLDGHTGRTHAFDPPVTSLALTGPILQVRQAGRSPVSFPDTPSEQATFPLHEGLPELRLSLVDTNPLADVEAHPDKSGNALSLGDKPLEQWQQALHEALELIRVALPDWFEELNHSLQRIIPVGYLPERHLSASYREAPGIAYLSLCDQPLTMAEALIHETQHTKFNLLSWIDPVLPNGMTCWTQSPVRPDLRPLWGVALAVHAFVPVAALHARLAELDHPIAGTDFFRRRRQHVLQGNQTGIDILADHAEWSRPGSKLWTQMRALHDDLTARTEVAAPRELVLPES